ncbi:hypothetical protein [Caudoviricetes sp.]|nr:hypothetical protein [Caudoviricetes sp.]
MEFNGIITENPDLLQFHGGYTPRGGGYGFWTLKRT